MKSPAQEMGFVLELTLRASRIYGSSSYYETSDTSSSDFQGIITLDPSSAGERCSIHLGAIPPHHLQTIKSGKAMSQLQIDLLYEVLSGNTLHLGILKERFEEKRSNLPEEMFDQKYRWFFTLAMERAIDVDDSEIDSESLLWISPNVADKVARDFQSRAASAFDLLATYSTVTLKPLFLEDVLVEDQVFLLADGRQPLRWPLWTIRGGSAELSLGYPSLDVDHLETVLLKANSLPVQKREWLESASYWYLRTLRERDPWKQFLWGFAALEILVHKVARAQYGNVVSCLTLNTASSSQQEASRGAIAKLVRQDSFERISLVSKFATMALALSVQTASDDVDQFNRVKKVRDRISHGERIREEDLPQVQCRELLERYMTLAIEWQLGMPPLGVSNDAEGLPPQPDDPR